MKLICYFVCLSVLGKHYANCKKPTFSMKKITDVFRGRSEVDEIQRPIEDEKETQEKVTSNNTDIVMEQTE